MGRFDEERREMIELLEERGISDSLLLDAMGRIERHLFLEEPFVRRAYEDCALPIGHEQTISQPYTVAVMTQALRLKVDERILEVGTGSGYQACILAEMGCRVFTIERKMELLVKARRMFDHLGYRIASKCGDGTVGWTEFAPFDGIIVTAGAPSIPEALRRQLGEGGRLVVPVGDRELQRLVVLTRRGNEFATEVIEGFKFVPLVGKNGWS